MGCGLVVLAPGGIAGCHPVPPVFGVLARRIWPHPVHMAALVTLFYPLMLEAVVPIAVCVAEPLGIFGHALHATTGRPVVTRLPGVGNLTAMSIRGTVVRSEST